MADREDIPADVRALVARHVDSVVQLELLLLLHSRPTTAWTPADAARELRVEPAWTSEQFARLEAKSLVTRDADAGDAYRYRPATPELARAVDGLAAAYVDRRVRLIALIYSKPTDTLRSFADAFRFRKEDADG